MTSSVNKYTRRNIDYKKRAAKQKLKRVTSAFIEYKLYVAKTSKLASQLTLLTSNKVSTRKTTQMKFTSKKH